MAATKKSDAPPPNPPPTRRPPPTMIKLIPNVSSSSSSSVPCLHCNYDVDYHINIFDDLMKELKQSKDKKNVLIHILGKHGQCLTPKGESKVESKVLAAYYGKAAEYILRDEWNDAHRTMMNRFDLSLIVKRLPNKNEERKAYATKIDSRYGLLTEVIRGIPCDCLLNLLDLYSSSGLSPQTSLDLVSSSSSEFDLKHRGTLTSSTSTTTLTTPTTCSRSASGGSTDSTSSYSYSSSTSTMITKAATTTTTTCSVCRTTSPFGYGYGCDCGHNKKNLNHQNSNTTLGDYDDDDELQAALVLSQQEEDAAKKEERSLKDAMIESRREHEEATLHAQALKRKSLLEEEEMEQALKLSREHQELMTFHENHDLEEQMAMARRLSLVGCTTTTNNTEDQDFFLRHLREEMSSSFSD